MIIKSLKFKNYRCFVDFNIELDENIITFIGKNGVGKSCIFDGILYSLFGFSQSSNRGGKNLIPNSTKPGEICELEMIFNLDGIDYKIIRRIKGKSHDVDAFLYRGDSPERPIAERDSGVNKAVEKLLGMDYGTFKMSVFSAQKDLSVFTNLPPEKRKTEIRKLLNLEVIKEAIKLAREDSKKFKIQNETWGSQLLSMEDLVQGLEKVKKDKVSTEVEIQKLKEEYQVIREKLVTTRQNVEIQEKIRDKVLQLHSKISQNNAARLQIEDQLEKNNRSLQELKTKQSDLDKIQGHKDIYLELQKELELQNGNKTKYENKKIFEDEIEKLREEYSAHQNECENLTKELADYKEIQIEGPRLLEHKDSLEREYNLLSTEYTTHDTNIKNISVELEELKAKIAHFQELGPDSVCPDCERTLGEDLDILINKYLTRIEIATKRMVDLKDIKEKSYIKITKINDQKKELQTSEEDYQKRLTKYTQFQTKLATYSARLKETTEKGTVLRNQIKDLGEFIFNEAEYNALKLKCEQEKILWEKVIALEAEIKTIPTLQNDIDSLNKKIEELKQITEGLSSERKTINFNEEEYQELKILLAEVERNELSKRQGMHELDVKRVIYEKDIQTKESEIQNQKELNENINSNKIKILKLESLMVILDEFETNLLAKVRPMVEERTSDLIRVTTRGKYTTLELDQDYQPILHDLNNKYDLERFSGGEQDLVNLCLRIAIADIVAQRSGGKSISFLVLDEIFGSQDDDRRQTIMETLQELTNRFRQIFLITHTEAIKESMPIVYEVKETERGNSVVALVN